MSDSDDIDLDIEVTAVDIEDLIGVDAMKIRRLAREGTIPSTRDGTRYVFILKDVIEALAELEDSSDRPRKGRKHAQQEDGFSNKVDAIAAGTLLWHKRVQHLGWAVAHVVDLDKPDDFAEIVTDSGGSTLSTLTRLVDEVERGKIFVLEPAGALRIISRQLDNTPSCPAPVKAALWDVIVKLDEWKAHVRESSKNPEDS
jgi:hypothetical protein